MNTLKTVKQQKQEAMDNLRESIRKSKEEQKNRPPLGVIMVRDPKTGESMTKDDYQEKYKR